MNKVISSISAAIVSVVLLSGCGFSIDRSDILNEDYETTTAPATPSETPSEPAPEPVTPSATPTAAPTVDASNGLLATLDSLTVEEPTGGEYNREDDFGSAWKDVDGNGCDTRNDILNRDLSNKTFDGDCTVLTGNFVDPYTGLEVAFVRGQKTSQEAPIDHVYSLKAAWQHGAQEWDFEKRVAFANDPDNLTVTTRDFNGWKSAKNPFDMQSSPTLPTNFTGQCFYATQYINVANEYGLSITKNDKATLVEYLGACS